MNHVVSHYVRTGSACVKLEIGEQKIVEGNVH